jgi:DNA-binding winged helix-turn-helix (wHTH) protein/Tfp pilus assembly protein PilF
VAELNDLQTNLSSYIPGSSFRSCTQRTIRFGVFELHLESGELRKCGLRIKLQQKPFQILRLLLEAPGQFVTRDRLSGYVWPDLHVNFDRSLNTAVNSLRRALGDCSENPRFVETKTGFGYRFIAPVENEARAVQSEEIVMSGRNLEPYYDYLKGRYFCGRLKEDDLRKSVAYFEAALSADPEYAPAYAGLADTYSCFAVLGVLPPEEAYLRAKKFVAAALRIDEKLAEAHASLGSLRTFYERDWANAEVEHKKALELDHNYARGHQFYAEHLSAMGRHEEALREIRMAQQLDPLSLVINVKMAWILYMAREFRGAMEQSWKTLAMEPAFAPAQITLGLACQQTDMLEDAMVELQNAVVCSAEHPAALASLGHVYASAGMRGEAEEIMRKLRQMSENRYVSPYWMALMHAALEERYAAFEWLDKARESADSWVVWLDVEPRFDVLRSRRALAATCI